MILHWEAGAIVLLLSIINFYQKGKKTGYDLFPALGRNFKWKLVADREKASAK